MKLTNLNRINDTLSRLEALREEVSMDLPNFYLTGTSMDALEETSRMLVSGLEKGDFLSFSGIVQHFSILAPYFRSSEDAAKFLSRLEESISIARDCYSAFRGIVVLALSAEWAELDESARLEPIVRAIRSHPELCFVVLLPVQGEEEDEKVKKVLYGCAAWVELNVELPTLSSRIDEFAQNAEEKGYQLSDEGKEYLTRTLEEECEGEHHLTNLGRIVEQIDLERRLSGDGNRTITVEDLARFVEPSTGRKEELRIGFALSGTDTERK